MKISALSWNIWSQDFPLLGWSRRRNAMLAFMQHSAADFLCLQEVRWPWIKDLEISLPCYKWVGTARDSTPASESTPLFYHRDRYTLLHAETFWLSDNPGQISKGWDALYPRTVTCCSFRINHNQREITVVNTHLDHWGSKSRELSARLIRRRLEQLPSDRPLLVAGDFNCPSRSLPWRILTENNFLQDCACDDLSPSWHGWAGLGLGWWKSRPDYIFCRNMKIRNYELMMPVQCWPPASDHRAILASFELLL